ncbi:hypothetical protein ABER68_04190 [Paenibacillus alvei]
MANLIGAKDALNTGRDKLNAAIIDAENAISKSDEALLKAKVAESSSSSSAYTAREAKEVASTAAMKADSLQSQLNEAVLNAGDSSAEAAQARVKEDGTSFNTLQARLNDTDVQVTRKAFGTYDFISKGIPALKKYENNPIFTLNDTDLPSLYWAFVVRVDSIITSPLGKYYMFYSTDHDSGNGGIGLAYSDNLFDWVEHSIIYTDLEVGFQTETPSVIFNEQTGYFHMYYQNQGVGRKQATVLAKSLDCINWERVGVAIEVPDVEYPGDGHTGYFRPFKIGNRWVGYHLMGGGSYSHCGISYSYDGDNWTTDPRPLIYSVDGVGNNDYKIAWNNSSVIEWKGTLYWVGLMTQLFNDPNGVNTNRVGLAPLNDDLRSFGAPVQYLLEPFADGESRNIRSVSAFVDEGKIYLFYSTDTSKFNVAFGGDL